MSELSDSASYNSDATFYDAPSIPPEMLISNTVSSSSADEVTTFASQDCDIESALPIQSIRKKLLNLDEAQSLQLIRQLSDLSGQKSENTGEAIKDTLHELLYEMYNRSDMKDKAIGAIWKNLTVSVDNDIPKSISTVTTMLSTFFLVCVTFPFLAAQRLCNLRTGMVPEEKTRTRTILNDCSGCVKPGEMLLVLGRPGSGCSTFLKMVCNQRQGYGAIDGHISYAGIEADEMARDYRGQIVYNDEEDTHFPGMSVGQTLRFGLQCTTPEKNHRRRGESKLEYQNAILDVMGKVFGITHTFNTKVGNQFIRGVSGGEKKRVSLAEIFLCRAALTGFDNSSRGLDASTALEYVRALRILTNVSQVSNVVTLYQAGQAIYDLFDKVLILYCGECIFFGSGADAVNYFTALGYVKESRQTSAEFLTSMTDSRDRVVAAGMFPPSTPKSLALAYQKSQHYRQSLLEITEFEATMEHNHSAQNFRAAHLDDTGHIKSVFQSTFSQQVYYCCKRQLRINFALSTFIIDTVTALIPAFIIGSLFYKQSQTTAGAFTRGGVLFSSLLFNALSAVAALSGAYMSRSIVQKQRLLTFYRPAAFELGILIADIPRILIRLTIYDFILYFLAGLQYQAGKFFINYLILFSTVMTLTAFFRAIANFTSSLNVVLTFVGLLVQLLVLYTGYSIPRPSMRGWFVWIYYLNPLAYAFEALITNEFRGLYLTCDPNSLVPRGGFYPNQGCTITGAAMNAIGIKGDEYLQAAFHYSFDHMWRNIGFLLMFFIAFTILSCLGAELQRPPSINANALRYKKSEAMNANMTIAHENANSTTKSTIEIVTDESGAETIEKPGHLAEVILTFRDLCYDVPDPSDQSQAKRLLNHVSGFVKPGTMTCLMGSSGAGKTTLLNMLAQRLTTGVISGELLVNGLQPPRSFSRNTGYCEQMDIHLPESTVREALQFSAILRQSRSVRKEEKLAYVEEVISLLEMEAFADALIGSIGSGLTIEQRKRVTIAVELVARPALLIFLDEPTSGLDSQASTSLILLLRKLAASGQALLVTLHQPSAMLFQQFDNILLLGRGGNTNYFGAIGPASSTMIDYFTRNGAQQCPEAANPAEWVLDVVGAGGGIGAQKSAQDWPQTWLRSSEAMNIYAEIDRIGALPRASTDQDHHMDASSSRFAETFYIQFFMVIQRQFRCHWRSPDFIANKLILQVASGLINCFTFFKLGHTVADQRNRLFSLFTVLVVSPPLIQALQPKFFHIRGLFTAREGRASMYHWSVWVTSLYIVELPYILVTGSLLYVCWYFGPGFPTAAERSGHVWLFVMVFELWFTSFAFMIAAISPNSIFAALLTPLLFTICAGFAGVTNPPDQIPTFWRRWMYPVDPFRYLMGGWLTLVNQGTEIRCGSNEFALFDPVSGQTCEEYAGTFVSSAGGYLNNPNATTNCQYCQYTTGDLYAASLDVHFGDRWRNYGILWAYVGFNVLMTFIFTWLFLGGLSRLYSRCRHVGRTAAVIQSHSQSLGYSVTSSNESQEDVPAALCGIAEPEMEMLTAYSTGGY